MKKPGYVNEMKSMISELVQYRIAPQKLEELSKEKGMPVPFRLRLHDLQVIYESFQEFLKGTYITAEEILEVLSKEAFRSRLLKDSVLVLDEFTGFTPIQYGLLEELMRYVKDIYVTVTLDTREDPYLCAGMQELFYLSKKTVRSLSKIAARQRMEILAPVFLEHGPRTRFCASRQLQWLEQNLFRDIPKAYQGEKGDLFLYSLPNPRQELLFLAGEIRRLAREEGCRYREIAVVCGDVESYGNYVTEIFSQYDIPYFLDKKDNISFHPFTEMIRTALRTVEADFSYEAVLSYLRCGLSGISREEIDLLENYLLANRIRGWRKWQENFTCRGY